MLTIQALAERIGAKFIGQDVPFVGASIDTRTIQSGELFVALKGEHLDGHACIPDAIEKGAAAVLVSAEQSDLPIAQILVEDVIKVLGQLASVWRDQFKIPVIAITGSCGKTTSKEMIASILKEIGPVCYTQGNYNNHLGAPLTLLRMKPEHRFAVIELGTNHPGEIDYLTKIVKPTVAVITNIREAHIGNFKNVDAIAEEKSAVYRDLAINGIAIINEDEPYAQAWHKLANRRHTVTFARESSADVMVNHNHTGVQCLSADLHTPLGNQAIAVPLLGQHVVENVLPAVACAMAVGASLQQVALGLAKVRPVSGRMCAHQLRDHVALIDDTYNNSPAGAKAAIEFLAHCPGKRILVWTHMAELGKQAETNHRMIGQCLAEQQLDEVLLIGDQALLSFVQAEYPKAKIFADKSEIVQTLVSMLDKGAASILIKGARSMQMETVVQGLMHDADA